MDRDIILIKYGDLYLKGKNKQLFINSLISNINKALFDFKIKIIKEFDNAKILFENFDDQFNIIEILKFIPGISFIIPCRILNRDLDLLKKKILSIFKNNGTFKVETKRKDKNYEINSLEFNRIIGSWILKNKNEYKVNVEKPDILLKIEISKKNFIFFTEKIKGVSGLPIGLNGNALSLLSGGIDSPVASYLTQRKGVHVDYLTFITNSFENEKNLDKIQKLVNSISLNGRLSKSKLYVINFNNILNELFHIEESYRIIIMRRIFLKIASKIANKINYNFLITGDSLGQVSSQTIESLKCVSNSINDILILRPLITFSKEEIIDIAKKIKTYNISISDNEDLCSSFVPKNPITKPKINKIIEIESKLDYIDELINKSIENI